MLYRKNLFAWEQGLRVLGGAGTAAAPWMFELPYAWYWVAAGVGLALTGLLGFCPACYMVGRRAPGGFGNKPAL